MAKVARPKRAKATRRRAAASRAKKAGPRVNELIVKAVSTSKERKGVSLAALKKALVAGGYDVDRNKARIKTAIKSLVAKGILVRGTGASRSLKIGQKAKGKPRKKARARKAAKARKRAVAKRAGATKKPGARKAKKRAGAKKTAKRTRRASKSRKRVAKKSRTAKKSRARKAARRKSRRASVKK